MYPSEKYPSYGTFIRNFCYELKRINIDFDLSVMTKSSNIFFKVVLPCNKEAIVSALKINMSMNFTF